MALEKAGIVLVAENYDTYIKQLKSINKAQQEAFKKVSIGSDFTKAAQQVSTQSKQMSTAMDSTWRAVQNLRSGFTQASTGMDTFRVSGNSAWGVVQNLRTSMDQASTTTGRFSGSFSGIKGMFANMGSTLSGGAASISSFASSLWNMIPGLLKWAGVLGAVMKAWQFFKASGDIAQRNETLKVTLETMGKAAGYTTEQIEAATEALRQQGITTQAAMSSLVRMSRANISWAEASKLAAIAQGAAVAAGMNSSDAFERLILGVQKMEPELLDELGITLQRSQAYKKFAAELGVSEMALTQQQKQQAILNEIYRQSESVLGVYDAAMETSGKKQGSLTRHVEETQASLGKLLLPFKELSVDMKTDFWKGIRQVAKGLESWIPIIRAVITGIKAVMDSFSGISQWVTGAEDSAEMFDRMGRGAHDWARVLVESFAIAYAAWNAVISTFSKDWEAFIYNIQNFSLADVLSGNYKMKPMEGGDFSKEFKKQFQDALGAAQKAFPEIFKTWEDLNKEIDTDIDLNPPSDETEQNTEELEKQKALLEAQQKAYEEINKIVEDYNQKVKDINADYEKSIAKQAEDFEKSKAKLADKTQKQLTKNAQDGEKQRQKLIQDANKQAIREEQSKNKELEREQQRFLLSQKHAYQQFQVQDRRLRAEGDVLALMELRENFDLQQKQQKESFDQDQKFSQEDAAAQSQERQQDLQERLKELDESISERQAELQQSYLEELAELQTANAEKLAELKLNKEQELEMAKQARDERLVELGKSLQDEADMTEEGMKQIYEKMQEIMGEDGPADALMKGFTDRTKEGFEGMVNSIKDQLKALEEGVNNLNTATAQASETSSMSQTRPGSRAEFAPQKVPMRQGGVGVVTGPATFGVETGQREAVMFAPLPTAAGSNLNVNMSGGFGITGAEPAGRAATEAALDRMVEEFGIAVRRLARR